MSAERRRIVVIVAVLTVFTAAGVFWLARLVLAESSPSPSAHFEFPASESPRASTTPLPPVSPLPTTTARAGGSTSTTATTVEETFPAQPRTQGATRTTKPRVPSSSPTSTRPIPPPPVPTHAIRVGGATLDNDNPRTMCAVFTNTRLGLPVTVTGVSVSGDVLEVDAGTCAEDDGIAEIPECVDRMTLNEDGRCFAGVTTDTDEEGQHTGTVRLGLRARCTSTEVAACDVAELRNPPPSPTRPAVITWTDEGEQVCYAVRPDDPSNPFCDE
jgi:hypothetical protein